MTTDQEKDQRFRKQKILYFRQHVLSKSRNQTNRGSRPVSKNYALAEDTLGVGILDIPQLEDIALIF